uniref:Uncharacterized protein n=1 Tax=Oryza sativa subsp. japonica TaxID=39947 RepID=Q84RX0_ORYSJ|nr:hypothetical protein [Oryza sativa Japonica Group]
MEEFILRHLARQVGDTFVIFEVLSSAGVVFVASLRNVRGPPKLQPCLTEKYDDGTDPFESLQICTTIIEAAWGDDRLSSGCRRSPEPPVLALP